VGDEVTLTLDYWTSPNAPLKYLVFKTNDVNGTGQGELLTSNPRRMDE